MRLLSTKTLEVIPISEDEIPPYAILSHTWDRDEVTLQDMQGSEASLLSTDSRIEHLNAKQGFRKVVEAAKLAASEGHDWIWIDTCCIDKTSSAELSEAINSMFKWYQDSEVCYVYLADATPVAQGLSKSSYEGIIRRSRWITRGWTLQELLAPRTVTFYSNGWEFIGRKDDKHMTKPLSKATGIDSSVLSGHISMHEVSVANRMGWACERKTRRQEDMAYCLMGLFGVNMPLLYGEGGVRAFIRLQNAILQAVDDQTIFAWSAPPGVIDYERATGLLAESPAYFKNAGTMYPMSAWYQRGEGIPWSITNRGLMVQLHLRPALQDPSLEEVYNRYTDYFDATLACSRDQKQLDEDGRIWIKESSPSIRLRRLWGDQYARVHTVGRISYNMHHRTEGEMKTVFVKQDQSLSLPSFTISDEFLGGKGDFFVSEVYPQDRWDSQSGIFNSGHFPQRSIQGLFRFSYLRGDGDPCVFFDVAVAVHSTASGQFEAFGILRPSKEEIIYDAYQDINTRWISTPRAGKAKLADEYRDKMVARLQLRLTKRPGGVSYVVDLVARAELEQAASGPL